MIESFRKVTPEVSILVLFAIFSSKDVQAHFRGLQMGFSDVGYYMPGVWLPARPSWQGEGRLNGAMQNTDPYLLSLVEKYSPPNHFSLAPGLNDTVQVLITLLNDSDQDYDLNGKSPQNWYKPQIFDESSDVIKAQPYLDSSQVKYRFRRMGGTGTLDMKVRAGQQDVVLLYDVWDLPVGRWQLIMRPSANIPNDVHGRTGGELFVNFPAKSLMDSIAAYEGNFWRLWGDGDTLKARTWIDTIFHYNENSFVGWGLTLELAYSARDSAGIADASFMAIKVLEEDLDPTVPHSTEIGDSLDTSIERAWYDHFLNGLKSIHDGWTN